MINLPFPHLQPILICTHTTHISYARTWAMASRRSGIWSTISTPCLYSGSSSDETNLEAMNDSAYESKRVSMVPRTLDIVCLHSYECIVCIVCMYVCMYVYKNDNLFYCVSVPYAKKILLTRNITSYTKYILSRTWGCSRDLLSTTRSLRTMSKSEKQITSYT